ncbi:hypothetical protein [Streptomyces sp. NPDC058867]|uniref:hypothetical protein n=1 Tax=unclassified Streptomyces TaxID=2593676 RepID=UPI0036A0FFDB
MVAALADIRAQQDACPVGLRQAVPPNEVLLDTVCGGVCWDPLLFSAEETAFKNWFPLAKRQLDFGEADIRTDPDSGTFSARLLVLGPTADGSA